MPHTRKISILLILCGACASPDAKKETPPGANEVIVLGMIHGGHRTNPLYGIDVVKDIVRSIKPDFILAEIPPDRFPRAQDEFRRTGRITEPRVTVFPEYTEAVFPLTRELNFVIVPCAAWTRAMADDRRRKLARYKTERKEEHDEMTAARRTMNRELKGSGDRPEGIHTDEYDRIVERGMEPYNRHFNEDLGAGGWDNINAAHYALIARALDRHRGEGKRFLITFGSWHKHWFLKKLRKRDDIVIRPLSAYWRP